MDLLLKNGVMVMNVKASEILELMNLGLIDAAPTITCNGLSNIPLTPNQPVKPSAEGLGIKSNSTATDNTGDTCKKGW